MSDELTVKVRVRAEYIDGAWWIVKRYFDGIVRKVAGPFDGRTSAEWHLTEVLLAGEPF